MKLLFEASLHRVHIAKHLEIGITEEKALAEKILRGQSIITNTEYVVNVETELVAARIWDGKVLLYTILGEWQFDHKNKNVNYFKFRPRLEIKKSLFVRDGRNIGKCFLYYTFNKYNQL